jgi:uncharacterized protein
VAANREVVEQAYEAFGKGDIPALLDLLDDGVEWSSPKSLPQGGSFRGKDGVGNFFAGVGAAWDPLEVEVEVIDDLGGELVVGVVHLSGTLRGGGSAGYGAAHVFTVHGNKITRFREYVDADGTIVG